MRLRRIKRKDHGSSSDSTPTNSSDTKPEIEIEPDVIDTDGRPFYPLDGAASQALVIHCGDPRFQTAFRRFVTEELGLVNYTPVVVGGGIHAFGVQSFLPKNFKILWEQIKFFIKEGKISQVILINHEDCKWYEKMKGYHPGLQLPLKGKLDLQTAALKILEDFSGVQVRSFWAGLDNGRIYFTEVSGSD